MKRALWGTLALLACGDDDGDDNPRMDASTLDGGLDAARDAAREAGIDAALITQCGPVEACQSGVLLSLPSLCIAAPANLSGDLWKVCVVDPQGRAAFIQLDADQVITSAGWTHSSYRLQDDTLSEQGTTACKAERDKLILASEDNLPDAGSTLCYRPNNI